MNELADYRRAIGNFVPSRGPRRKVRWKPSWQRKTTTSDLLKLALAGLLWISAVYITVDVDLELLNNASPIPVSDFYAKIHTLPCLLERELGAMALWGKGGLPGLFDMYMGIENWHNRLTWALVSYGTHELFLAFKLKTAGDIELNPGPIPSQAEKGQEKASQGKARRTTRTRTREEAKIPQLRRQCQAGDLLGDTTPRTLSSQTPTSTSDTSTSVSRLHLTPGTESKQDRYLTPISKELEEAKKNNNRGNETAKKRDEQLEDKESKLATSTPLKQNELEKSSEQASQRRSEPGKPGESEESARLEEEVTKVTEGDSTVEENMERGTAVQSSKESEPEPEPESGETEPEPEPNTENTGNTENVDVSLNSPNSPNSSPNSPNSPNSSPSRPHVYSTPKDLGSGSRDTKKDPKKNKRSQLTSDGLLTSVGESPEQVIERARVSDDTDDVATTTTTTTTTTSKTDQPNAAAAMDDSHRSQKQAEDDIDNTRRNYEGRAETQNSSTIFSHFPGHSCDYDRKRKPHSGLGNPGHAEEYKNNGDVCKHKQGKVNDRQGGNGSDNDSDKQEAQVTEGVFSEEDSEVAARNSSNMQNIPNTSSTSPRRRPSGYSGHSQEYTSRTDTVNSMSESGKHKTGTDVDRMSVDRGSMGEKERMARERRERERVGSEHEREQMRRRNKGAHKNPHDREHLSSHTHSHSHRYTQGQSTNQSYNPLHGHAYSHPHHTHSYMQPHTRQQGHHSQMLQHQSYQQPQYAHPPHYGGGDGYTEGRGKVSNQGFPNTDLYYQGTSDAMNDYYEEWRGRNNPQEGSLQEGSLTSAVSLIMSKMESQQAKLQKQLQFNQATTERGIEDTQQRISHMHKDIQNIQQEVRETNMEVQQNKDEIRLLQDRQSKLETQQDSALAQTQRDLEKAQEEIKQMRQSLESMDEAMEARDEELDEIQDELMEARKNLNRVESHNRRGNIKIFGIAEHQGSDKEKCDERAIKLFNDYMPGQDWNVGQVEKAHRLGQYKEGGRPRPILVKMVNPQDTFYILGSRKSRDKMKQDNIHIAQDLTRDQQDILKQEKDKGNLAYFVGGKLVVRVGEGKSTYRDNSRGRRNDRGSARNREGSSSSRDSSGLRGKRDRRGSAISRDHSRADTDSRTRDDQNQRQDNTTGAQKPWRFGSSNRGSSTSRDRREARGRDKSKEEDQEFKVPKGPAYRASARPAHRNPYHYQNRSVSRQTRNSRNCSPQTGRKNNAPKSNTSSGQNSGAPSPSNSPAKSGVNSPSVSGTASKTGSRHASRHSSRSPSQQSTPNKDKEAKEDDTQRQKELEELRERLRQLSEDTPAKQKPAEHTQPPKETNRDGSPDKTQVDSEPGSPETNQPPKRQRLTYRRSGDRKYTVEQTSNDNYSSTQTESNQSENRPRPRARVYSGRGYRGQSMRRPYIPHKGRNTHMDPHLASPSISLNPQPQLSSKPTSTAATETGVRQSRTEPNIPDQQDTHCEQEVQSQGTDNHPNSKPMEPKERPSLMEQNNKGLQKILNTDNDSPNHEAMELSPGASDSAQVGPHSPMETNQNSPSTPQAASAGRQSDNKQKKGSWGEKERTKNMRSSLDMDNTSSGKQSGAIRWKMVEDDTDSITKHHEEQGPTQKAPIGKANTAQDKKKVNEALTKSKEKKGESRYSSIWEPPKTQNLSKEGCSPTRTEGQKNTTSPKTKSTNSKDKGTELDRDDTNSPRAGKNINGAEEGWKDVMYRKTVRKIQKQQSITPVESTKKITQTQQDRGRTTTKKKNANQKKKETKGNDSSGSKATTSSKKGENNPQKPQKEVPEQISLQERVNIAVAIAASKEDRRSQSSSRQAYLTTEGTVVRNLQSKSGAPRGQDRTGDKQ